MQIPSTHAQYLSDPEKSSNFLSGADPTFKSASGLPQVGLRPPWCPVPSPWYPVPSPWYPVHSSIPGCPYLVSNTQHPCPIPVRPRQKSNFVFDQFQKNLVLLQWMTCQKHGDQFKNSQGILELVTSIVQNPRFQCSQYKKSRLSVQPIQEDPRNVWID